MTVDNKTAADPVTNAGCVQTGNAKLAALQRLHDGIVSDEPNWDCPGCRGGDKWPVSESVWLCSVCDTEYFDTDENDGAVMTGER